MHLLVYRHLLLKPLDLMSLAQGELGAADRPQHFDSHDA